MADRTYQSETLRAQDAFTGRTVEIDHAGGIIAAIRQADQAQERDALPPWLGPGLVDLQINGAHGHDFNEASLDADTVSALAPLLAQHGITAYFPTLVTTSDKVLLRALNVLARSCQEAGTSGLVAGIHLEGPFISPETGPRAHTTRPSWAHPTGTACRPGRRCPGHDPDHHALPRMAGLHRVHREMRGESNPGEYRTYCGNP